MAQQSCVPTPGFYCPSSTGLAVSCPPGYYCTGEVGNDHIPCPINTFNPDMGGSTLSGACQNCPKFFVGSAVGLTTCSLCAAGTFYADNNGPGPDFAGSCTTCAAGASSIQNSTTCSSCLPGTFSNTATQTCSTCRPGSYQDKPGAANCIECPSGTYTYNTNLNGSALFTPIWGASSAAQCLNLPTFGAPLICLPGTYMKTGTCLPCPLGYYCPSMQTTPQDPLAVRSCPGGSMSVRSGAISESDCTQPSILQPFFFDSCSIAPGGNGALNGLVVTSAVTSLSTGTLFFSTGTALYRVLLQTTTLQNLAGVEGVSGAGNANNGIGSNVRFTSITAIGVDFDSPEATVVVVGDGNLVRMINVFTRQVTLLGSPGDVSVAGGIALRRDSLGSRKAYVSDTRNHRIIVFDLQNLQSNLVAGSSQVPGSSGNMNAEFAAATFNAPKGLAFLEKHMNSSKMLLVADSGNGLIRIVDTDTRVVSTFFTPLDKTNPELVAPSSITVAMGPSSNAQPMIYITDNGVVRVLQFPLNSDTSVKVLSSVKLTIGTANNLNLAIALPYGNPSTGLGNVVGFEELVVLDTISNSLKTLVHYLLAATPAGGGGAGTCHLVCKTAVCGQLQPAQLCGNSFLDPGEECDDGGAPGSGCDVATCKIKSGFTCPLPLTACMSPCLAYPYPHEGPNAKYCEQDCRALTPPSGYTVNSTCGLNDIDECAEGTAQCGLQTICENTQGSYICTCLHSYFGDGIKCVELAFAVYTVVDLPSSASDAFIRAMASPNPSVTAVLTPLKRTYAQALVTFLPQSMLTNTGFALNTTDLAIVHTSVSVDTAIDSFTRLQLVTLFPTFNMAAAAAANTPRAVLQTALSRAVYSNPTGVNVFQAPKTRTHRANSFTRPSVIDGWGMNITGVTYNRTCVVPGVTPKGGCWQVEMIYVGGQAMLKPDEATQPSVMQQSKNVLYIPRIDHDPVTMKLLTPSQALTESSGMFFPCSTKSASAAGLGVTKQATACCLRDFQATYRPNAQFTEYLNGSSFRNAVPEGYCNTQGIFNDTYPLSDIVFELPPGDATNDMVVGKIEGMPNSEVRLLETLDYTTRTFRVLLVLEEGDLRNSASTIQGVLGAEYNLTFFVGLANFRGMGGSVLSTRNVQQYITVRKSNVLTISAYGANQDPLVSAVDMQLMRIKVADFFQPTQYLYYLQPLFTLPNIFAASPSGVGIVPLDSIRVIRTKDGLTASATDPGWQQACSNSEGPFVYANTSLQQLVQRAQTQKCVQTYLQICVPPQTATSLVTFGIPLPLDMINPSNLNNQPPDTIQAEFVVQAFDTIAKSIIMTTLTLAVEVNALSLNAQCESVTASQTLADIITGDIYIGTATNDYEWETTIQKKTNIDVPGRTPSNSMEFQTVTVQGAVMTFAALGDPAYFEDPRALTQTVNIQDIHTVHFLEPLGGKGGPSPNFEAVKKLFLDGDAFTMRTDPTNHTSWLEPTAALLAICPRRPTAGRMVCITRVESTIRNNVLIRNPLDVVEIRPGEQSSVTNMQNLMSRVIAQGGESAYTRMMGTNFSHQLIKKLNLNTRYRKAYVVNPVVDWSYQAMQLAQAGSTAFTVCTKIIAIGMITINTPAGTQLARRLLSTTFDLSPNEDSHSSARRELMQAANSIPPPMPESFAPTRTQTSNSMFLELDIPGYDPVTQLCNGLLNVPYQKCSAIQFQTQITGAVANEICTAYQQGQLESKLVTALQNGLIDPDGFSGIIGVFLLDYSLHGCPTTVAGRRLLQSGEDIVVMINRVLLGSMNGTSLIQTDRLYGLANFLNNKTWTSILGGGGYVAMISVSLSNNNQLSDIRIDIKGASNNTNHTQIKEDLKKVLDNEKIRYYGDIMINDKSGSDSSSGAIRSWVVVSSNLLLLIAMAHVLIYESYSSYFY